MIYIFTALIAAVSFSYWFFSQYINGDILLIIYLLFNIAACVLYFFIERRKRFELIRRMTELFNGGFHSVTDEEELSGLERQVVRLQRNAAAREAKVEESYRDIAALVSDIAHQCKTPLTSVMMYSELEPSEENSAAVHSQAEKLSFLLDALTKLSKCEGGLICGNLRPEVNPVQTLVINAVNGIIAAAEVKNIEIISDVKPNLASDSDNEITARFDMRWTEEALFNLLDNAVKYSPSDGIVYIKAREYEMFVRIDIADSGIGIPESEQVNVWKRFYRGKNVGDVSSGVGIGLYLSRLILCGEGGRVSVKSEVGHGSTFSVYLPKL